MNPSLSEKSSPTQPSAWERSSFVRLFRWLISGRTIRRGLIGLAWAVTLVALAYGVENWRGRRAWNRYRTGLEARGAQLDLAALIPKPIPDDRNFAATPFVQSWFQITNYGDPVWNDQYEQASRAVTSSQTARNTREFVDLAAWALALQSASTNEARRKFTRVETAAADAAFPSRSVAAAAVLRGLEASAPRLDELREASRRPEVRYPVHYNLDNPWGTLLPHLAKVKVACLRLQLRASARLAAGENAGAFEDVMLALTLADSLRNDPFAISLLVRIACLQIAIQPIWEGLAERRWSEPQLQALQTRLTGFNFFAELSRSLELERAAGIWTADLLAQRKYRFSQLDDDSSGGPPALWDDSFRDLVGTLAPRGWYRLEQLNYCLLLDRQTSGAFDADTKRVSPVRIADNAKELEEGMASGRIKKDLSGVLRHQFLASLLLPNLKELPYKAAVGQVAVDQAWLACALERYRLAEGKFPESLTSLVPRWVAQLPHDPLTGESFRYRRTDDGQFVLYSVGWNHEDDDGIPGKTHFDTQEGDWVWQYPKQ